MRLLLVEDDDRVAAAQQLVLRRHGITTTRAGTARRALQLLNGAPDGFDVIVLDLGLPDGDGLTLCRDIRRVTDTPLIISSARGDVATRLHGLHTGADDYLTKPYDLRELVARIHALTRRRTHTRTITSRATARTRNDSPDSSPTASPGGSPGTAGDGSAPPAGPSGPAGPGQQVVAAGPVRVDLARRTLHIHGTPVTLTTKEFDLVALLARAPGVVFTRDQITAALWGVRTDRVDHNLDVHINRIRAKAGQTALIGNVRGVGYRLDTHTHSTPT